MPTNNVQISGYLGQWPQEFTTQTGKRMLVLDVRLEEWGKKSIPSRNWFTCKVMGKSAEFCDKLKLAPGDLVFVTGTLGSQPRDIHFGEEKKSSRETWIWAFQIDLKRPGKMHEGGEFDDEQPIELP